MQPKPLILVVDDHPEVLWSIQMILECTYRVVVASNGVEGLSQAATLRPDLIVSDLSMPALNGNEMARAIRERPGMENVPIIFISGNPIQRTRPEECFPEKVDFLEKPFSPAQLEQKIAFWLSVP